MTLENDLRVLRARSSGESGGLLQFAEHQFRSMSRVLSAGTTLQSSDGASQITTVYEVDMTAGQVMLGGVTATIAALDDKDLLDAAETTSYTLAGAAPSALSADGKTYDVAICVFLVSGAPVVRFIFGAEADDASEVAPTVAQCYAAMVAAGESGYRSTPGLLIGRIKIQRVAVDTITMTHTDVDAVAETIISRGIATIGV